MNKGDILVKKERSGKVGPISGQKADEYTEKYDYITKAVYAAEEIKQGAPCTPQRIADITTGQVVVNDMSPSKIKKELLHDFKGKLVACGCKKKRKLV